MHCMPSQIYIRLRYCVCIRRTCNAPYDHTILVLWRTLLPRAGPTASQVMCKAPSELEAAVVRVCQVTGLSCTELAVGY